MNLADTFALLVVIFALGLWINEWLWPLGPDDDDDDDDDCEDDDGGLA